MGDAGPVAPASVAPHDDIRESVRLPTSETTREINILVTGFGSFASFTTNPSYLITRAVRTSIDPAAHQDALHKYWSTAAREPMRVPGPTPYTIRIHPYPSALRTSYGPTATLIPRLISSGTPTVRAPAPGPGPQPPWELPENAPAHYDYVLHIGMAAGRNDYTLETRAHRDHYKIKDVDDRDGFISGEYVWKREHCPEVLPVGWDKADVLARWKVLTDQVEGEYETEMMQQLGLGGEPTSTSTSIPEVGENPSLPHRSIAMMGKGRRAVVNLSDNAGRFLCEFILYTSLSTRWKEARAEAGDNADKSTNPGKAEGKPSTPSINVDKVENSTDHGHDHDPHNSVTAAITASDTQSSAASHSGQRLVSNDVSLGRDQASEELASERIGKVAFLHVPGETQEHDIARGVRVAETAILALVSSWEDGFRNRDLYRSA